MVDTNVHFQDTVRLVQRLIELRKENWELAVYPGGGPRLRAARELGRRVQTHFPVIREEPKRAVSD